ncbi:MAG: zinc ribbon domain-containing protein [Deltaproteobacteria bacterium]|nr:zinc ribbon domain-containing protein [Deltaproteobacteria bacterium]
MPIYEFRCVDCGHVQEVLFTSSSDTVQIRCQECGSEVLDRVISRTSHVMGASRGESSSPSMTTRSCGPGNSCTTLQLPGHTR